MKSKLTRLLIISWLLAIGSLNSVAQEKKPGQVEEKKPGQDGLKVPPDGTFKVLGPQVAFGKVVKGSPYSAMATTEHIQTLSDGNQIIRKNESKLYRDSEGRTRIEQSLETIGKWTVEGKAHQIIFINDPVAGTHNSLDPHNRTVLKARKGGGIGVDEKLVMTQKMILDASRGNLRNNPPMGNAQPPLPWAGVSAMTLAEPGKSQEVASADGRRKTEALSKQVIEGVEAEGTRTILTIPAGEIGNTLPIEIVDEYWYSPELQIMVMTKHSDPRSGETTYRLTNINRSEPDRALFEVPADYTIADEPAKIYFNFQEGTVTPIPAKKKKPEEER